MTRLVLLISLLLGLMGLPERLSAQADRPNFRVLAIAEKGGGVHAPFVAAARKWLQQEAQKQQFAIDYIETTDSINAAFLDRYQVFIQLNYPPYNWTDTAKSTFTRYIQDGKIGWIGFHHASLLGEFDGFAMWPWFSEFMGGIRYKNYIPTFSTATVSVEARQHPCMKNVPMSFVVQNEEWYVYDRSPRPNVNVLASVDESTYKPSSTIKMGDHPVIWSNERVKARNLYIFMGHHPDLFRNGAFTTIVHNAIGWASRSMN
ncbi:ThuA domain-containing protein [Spirosoma sp. KUDC1026]|uniref:ThuA domain-containing protein n=1 Tax=Spirosoma sp. KUDC1026 TaxID=2745947 RepID=UPI00159B88EC|nr:ThuA domain-containing protein [Spirosoma sp. KUDC1026]QKZ14730.1 ThuA domain-containing protein [Spirosoma sp. KUDC1026]